MSATPNINRSSTNISNNTRLQQSPNSINHTHTPISDIAEHSITSTDPSAERLRRVSEQAKRRVDVQRELVGINSQLEREDTHWQQQQDKFSKLIDRSEVGALTSKELHKYLIRTNKLYATVQDYIDTVEPFGTQEAGTLASACSSHDVLRKTTSQSLSDQKNKSTAELLRKASELSRIMTYRMESLDDAGRKLLKQVRSDRQHMNDAWNNYVTSIDYRTSREQYDKPLSAHKDPYLLCRAYDKEQSQLRATEAKYRKDMMSMYNDMITEDKQRIEQIKSILNSNLQSQKQLLQTLIAYTDNTINVVNQISSEADVSEFIQTNGLQVNSDTAYTSAIDTTQPRLNTTLPSTSPLLSSASSNTTQTIQPSAVTASNTISVFELPAPNRDPHVVLRLYSYELDKEGALYRQGKIIRSSWKLIHGALSKTGLFHYGEADDIKGPADASISLSECYVQLATQRDPAGFEIVQPTSSWIPLTSSPTVHYFKATSPQIAVEWVTALRKYTLPPPVVNVVPAANEPTPTPVNDESNIDATESYNNDTSAADTDIHDPMLTDSSTSKSLHATDEQER